MSVTGAVHSTDLGDSSKYSREAFLKRACTVLTKAACVLAMQVAKHCVAGQDTRRPWRPMRDRVPREHKLIVGKAVLRCGLTPAGTGSKLHSAQGRKAGLLLCKALIVHRKGSRFKFLRCDIGGSKHCTVLRCKA